MMNMEQKTQTEKQALDTVNSIGLLDFYSEIKEAFEDTGEFNGYECSFGFKLGTCKNSECIHCRTKRALDKV